MIRAQKRLNGPMLMYRVWSKVRAKTGEGGTQIRNVMMGGWAEARLDEASGLRPPPAVFRSPRFQDDVSAVAGVLLG